MDRERLDNWCEWTIFGLVLAILVMGPLTAGLGLTSEFEVVRNRPFFPLLGLTIIAMVVWALRFWVGTKERFLWPPICWTVLAFVLYAIIRYRMADLEYVARMELLRVLVYGFLFLIVVDTLHRQDFTTIASLVLISLAMLISTYAIYQYFTNSSSVWYLQKPADYVGRASGTFIYPNNYAAFVGMLLPLGLAFTLASRLSYGTRVLVGYASLMMMVGLALSLSRGGWIASGVGLIFFFSVLMRYRETRLPAILFFVGALCAGIYFAGNLPKLKLRWNDMFRGQTMSNESRPRLWRAAVEIWKLDPWVGSGPGHFEHRFPAHRDELVQGRPRRAHNDYLNTLADWGVVGGALVLSALSALGVGIVWSWKYLRRTSDLAAKPSNRSAFALGAGAGLLTLAIHSVFDFNMHLPANAILAVSLMAMTSGFLRFATDRFWVRNSMGLRLVVTAVSLGGAAYLLIQLVGRVQEYRLFRQAEVAQSITAANMKLRSDLYSAGQQAGTLDLEGIAKLDQAISQGYSQRLELLQLAAKLEPMNPETPRQLGEVNRDISWAGGPDSRDRAEEAIRWFQSSSSLNPFEAFNPLWEGLCLDRLGDFEQAEPIIQRALALDPKNYYLLTLVGYHYFMKADYVEAKRLFLEAQRIADWRWATNDLAVYCLNEIAQIEGSRR